MEHDEGRDAVRHGGVACLLQPLVEPHPVLNGKARAGRLDERSECRGWRDHDHVGERDPRHAQHPLEEARRQVAALLRR